MGDALIAVGLHYASGRDPVALALWYVASIPAAPAAENAEPHGPSVCALLMSAPNASAQQASWRSISIFFPCHNEAANVAGVVHNAVARLGAATPTFEVIVIDDGSTDGTRAAVEALATADARVRVVSYATNLGYGHALRTGFAAARYDLVGYTDGDGQYSLDDLPAMLQALDVHGFVLGYRAKRADPFYRRANAWLWRTLVRLVLGVKARDIDCGFKLFRREVVQGLSLSAGRGAVISAELVTKAVRAGHTFAEVGVRHFPRTAGTPSGNSLRVILNSFVDIARLWRDLR